MAQARRLVLASSSNYRRAPPRRLRLGVRPAPDCNDAPLAGEAAQDTALRLSIAKARAVAPRFPDALIIGSDQVATRDGERLGKPGAHDRAVEQLRSLSGRAADFFTAVAVLDARSGAAQTRVVPCRVAFRTFHDPPIQLYLTT